MRESKQRSELLEALEREMRRQSIETVLFNQAVADRLGINLTDLKCSSILQLEGALTAGKLAELTGLTTGAITGVVDRLEKAGIVERAADPDDRRRVIIRPIAKRDREVGRLFEALTKPMSTLLARFATEQLASIVDFTSRSNAALVEARAELRKVVPEDTRDGGERDKGEFSAPLGRLTSGRLEFARGASQLQLQGDREMPQLYRARFEGPVPSVRQTSGTVAIQYGRPTLAEAARYVMGGAKNHANVTLNGSIPWEIDVRGGLYKVNADLRALPLSSLSVTGGASDVFAHLPEPIGIVAVRVTGGANQLVFHRAVGVAARLHVTGGANKLRFDDQTFGAVGGEVSLETPGWKNAANRYDIRLIGGASVLTVDTR